MKRALSFGAILFLVAACASFKTSRSPVAPSKGASGSAPNAPAVGRPMAMDNKVSDLSLDPRGVDFAKAPQSVAFSCCGDQNSSQPMWKTIVASDPDLFLYLGDALNSDQVPIRALAEQYKKLNRLADYREARQKIPFMAIWNDGDLGTNDGGLDAPTKAAAHRQFLSYWTYAKDAIPFNRDGLYHAKLMGGIVSGRRHKKVTGSVVQVIMLDTRSFRSPLKRVEDAEHPEILKYTASTDKSTTILGAIQWEWLEEQLRKPAQLRIIASPIQVVATEHSGEKWANFPHERERLFQLLRKTNAKNVVILSGDRRLGSIAKTDIKGWGMLYDITAGPLNHPVIMENAEKDRDYIQAAYHQENFGYAHVDWKHKKLKVDLRNLEGATIQTTEIKLR